MLNHRTFKELEKLKSELDARREKIMRDHDLVKAAIRSGDLAKAAEGGCDAILAQLHAYKLMGSARSKLSKTGHVGNARELAEEALDLETAQKLEKWSDEFAYLLTLEGKPEWSFEPAPDPRDLAVAAARKGQTTPDLFKSDNGIRVVDKSIDSEDLEAKAIEAQLSRLHDRKSHDPELAADRRMNPERQR